MLQRVDILLQRLGPNCRRTMQVNKIKSIDLLGFDAVSKLATEVLNDSSAPSLTGETSHPYKAIGNILPRATAAFW